MGRVIGFIPVRAGSKSIPGKNIKNFCGKPLVYWTAAALNECNLVNEVYVATDGEEIAKTVNAFGLSKLYVVGRSDDSATDTASTESALLEFIEKVQLQDDDTLVLVQATSPLIESQDIDRGIAMVLSHKGPVSVISAVRTKRFFWSTEGVALNYEFQKRPRRQDFDGMFMENGAFYISRVGDIRKSRCRISSPVLICETPECTGIELDEPIDWEISEKLLSDRLRSESVFRTDSPKNIKAILMDVDGVLTDSGMYYSESGEEIKKFNTRDGMGVELARNAGFITGIITSENTKLVERRAKKMGVNHLKQSAKFGGKLQAALDICLSEGIGLENIAYIGDDLNCKELLSSVGYAACPSDAHEAIKSIPGINVMMHRGGCGVVREMIDIILREMDIGATGTASV